MDDELGFDLGTGLTVIYIVLEDDQPPQIDLDGCHPLVAANIFRNAAEMIEEMMTRPTITTLGYVVASDEAVYMEMDSEGGEYEPDEESP